MGHVLSFKAGHSLLYGPFDLYSFSFLLGGSPSTAVLTRSSARPHRLPPENRELLHFAAELAPPRPGSAEGL